MNLLQYYLVYPTTVSILDLTQNMIKMRPKTSLTIRRSHKRHHSTPSDNNNEDYQGMLLAKVSLALGESHRYGSDTSTVNVEVLHAQ